MKLCEDEKRMNDKKNADDVILRGVAELRKH